MVADPLLAAAVTEEFDKLQLARQLKTLRESRKLSQAELATMVGTQQPAIARIESGRGVPRLDFLHRVAVALGGRLDVRLVVPHRMA
jgi:transcriptional regulator with XRE-family HTH domain